MTEAIERSEGRRDRVGLRVPHPLIRAVLLALAQGFLTSEAIAQNPPTPPRLKAIPREGESRSGERVYLARCWPCHGLAGDGRGPAAGGMAPPPTDFSSPAALAGRTDASLLDAILKGKPGTAMYAQPLDPTSALDVLAFVRSLSRNPGEERKLLDLLARGDHEAGRTLYNVRCWPCHGPTGKGNGPAATALRPPPADFTDPDRVKARTGAHLYAAITLGVPGTAMAAQRLPDKEVFDLIAHLRSLVPYGEDTDPAGAEDSSPASRSHAKEIYEKRCWACHGSSGEGDGPAAAEMIPPPTPFADFETMRTRTAQDWSSAIRFGVPGTAMYPQRLTEREIREIVAYLRSLGRRKAPIP